MSKYKEGERITYRAVDGGRVYSRVPAPVAINKLGEYEDAEEEGRLFIMSREAKADADELLAWHDGDEAAGLEILAGLFSGKSKEEQETIWSSPPCRYGIVCDSGSDCFATNFCDTHWTEILFDPYTYHNGKWEVKGEK